MPENSVDFTTPLQAAMAQADIRSFRQLSQISGVPRSQILKLRRGQFERIPFGSFVALANAMRLPVIQVLGLFQAVDRSKSIASQDPQETGQPTHQQTHQQTRQQWEREGLDCLESLILQLPTASVAAHKNPTAPAIRLLPLLKPIDQLLASWAVTPIAQVGAEVDFDPQLHQWMGTSAPPAKGETVRVSHVGYFHGDRLLHRAKVKPL